MHTEKALRKPILVRCRPSFGPMAGRILPYLLLAFLALLLRGRASPCRCPLPGLQHACFVRHPAGFEASAEAVGAWPSTRRPSLRRHAVDAQLLGDAQLLLAEGDSQGLVAGGLALGAALLGALAMSQQRADGAKEEELPPWADMQGA